MANEIIILNMLSYGVSITELADTLLLDDEELVEKLNSEMSIMDNFKVMKAISEITRKKGEGVMDTQEFTRELAARKGISEQTAYRYINSVMDTIRQILAEGDEVRIGSFGRFTVISDLSGNKTPAFSCGKSLRQAVNAGEGIL